METNSPTLAVAVATRLCSSAACMKWSGPSEASTPFQFARSKCSRRGRLYTSRGDSLRLRNSAPRRVAASDRRARWSSSRRVAAACRRLVIAAAAAWGVARCASARSSLVFFTIPSVRDSAQDGQWTWGPRKAPYTNMTSRGLLRAPCTTKVHIYARGQLGFRASHSGNPTSKPFSVFRTKFNSTLARRFAAAAA